jgi:stringent starvation protein B
MFPADEADALASSANIDGASAGGDPEPPTNGDDDNRPKRGAPHLRVVK